MIARHLVLLTYCGMLWLSVAEHVSCKVLEKPWGPLHGYGSCIPSIGCLCLLGGCIWLCKSSLWVWMLGWDTGGACMWSWLDPIVSSGVPVGREANWFWFVGERLSKLLHWLGQNWREMGRATGCPGLLLAMIWSQIWEHHGLVVECSELFWELMTLEATVGALLVALVHSIAHCCGFLGAGYTGNIGRMVPVCIDVGSCWLATSRSGV